MPSDEELETRIKGVVSTWKNTDAKKMFGGICDLINGDKSIGNVGRHLSVMAGTAFNEE